MIMSRLSYDGYCAGIIAQTDQLRSAIQAEDMTVPEILGDARLLDFWLERVSFG